MATEDERRQLVASLEPFAPLVERFVRDDMTAESFQTQFIAAYLASDAEYSDYAFGVIDRLFAVTDDFVPDAELRARAGGLDEDQLRAEAQRVLELARMEPGA